MGGASALEVDHYAVLGFPPDEDGSKLSVEEIKKAFKNQSLKVHPDKCPDDPKACSAFQNLKLSFDFLMDDSSRSSYDALLRSRLDQILRESQRDAKRRKLAADLEEKDRVSTAATSKRRKLAADLEVRERGSTSAAAERQRPRRQEEKVRAELLKEIAELRMRNAMNGSDHSVFGPEKGEDKVREGFDEERSLKVYWEKKWGDYGAVKLRELFEMFGVVEDVVIKSEGLYKRGCALVVMSSKADAVLATQIIFGSFSNPLLVLPCFS